MSIRVLRTADGEEVMYDSVTMRAFGPVFHETSAEYGLDDFIDWLGQEFYNNPLWMYENRQYELYEAYNDWLKEMKEAHQ